MEQARALLIRRTRYGEASLILTWFTEEFGKLKSVVKGALRPKSQFAGKVDLFFLCDLDFIRARTGELHGTRELRVVSSFEGIRQSYLRTLVAGYFSELVETASELEHHHPELFDLTLRAFGYLSEKEPDRKAVLFFEKEVCRLIELETGQTSVGTLEHRLLRVMGRVSSNRAEILSRM